MKLLRRQTSSFFEQLRRPLVRTDPKQATTRDWATSSSCGNRSRTPATSFELDQRTQLLPTYLKQPRTNSNGLLSPIELYVATDDFFFR
ncbi:hypothetical protein LIER_25367 [Lithospermum erythrorhizon]|uniref:Uncharacterized protein n=1 Tax=Lithospermum erythrorhizon TaxID=34254 RepID=A0AAV3R7I5_LITER